jgi:hypothetical protein
MFAQRSSSYAWWINLDQVGSVFVTEVDSTWQIQAYLTTTNGTPTSGNPVTLKGGYATEQDATDALEVLLRAVGAIAVP